MATVSQPGFYNLQALSSLGALGAGFRLYTYATGTTTHKVAYTESTGTTAQTYTNDGAGGQYIALDARGELPSPLYLTGGAYDLALKTPAGATVWTRRADPQGDASLAHFLPAGTGATARTVQAKLRESVSVKDFGAVGDGVTDDAVAIQSADRAGTVFVPADNYLVNISPTPLSFASPVELAGENRQSILAANNLAASGTQTVLSFASDQSSLSNLQIQYSSNPGQIGLGVVWNTDNLNINNVLFDGNTTQSGGVRNHTIHAISAASSGTQNGLDLKNVEITGVTFPLLKANATVSQQNRIKVQNSFFHENYGVDLLFNSPAVGSKINDVTVTGNTFGPNFAEDIGGFSHRMSMAGNVENFRVIGNHAEGQGNEFWRAEEAAKAGIVLGNTAQLGDRHGIEITDNNIGGTAYTPEQMIVADNVLRGTKTAGSRGVHLVLDASSLPPLVKSTLHHNIITSWETGIRLAFDASKNSFDGNVINDCTTGVLAQEPTVTLRESLIIDCPTGITSATGGMFGRQHFRDTSSTTPLISAPVTADGNKASLLGWTWESGRFDIASTATTDIPIIAKGDVFHGEIKIHLWRLSTQYSILIAQLDFDGATLTITEKRRYQSGNIILNSTPMLISGSDFVIRLTNASGASANNLRLQCAFDGIHVWD